jgi:hypothetical protein
MIQANELRIGNLVDIGKEFNILELVDFVDMYENNTLEHYQPIPLTEDWLLKFGFESTYEEFDEEDFPCVVEYWLFTDSVTKFEIDYATKTGYTVNIANVPTGHALIIRRKLEYVHQLQNLYFALTGTELTLKENELL